MAIFKCKMCGGDLEISEGATVIECDYCGTKQTVPTAKDENLHGLFNRANTLRIKSEFDKAEQLYEKILQADDTQAEAYWGLILCKYGIEYVEDPKTFKRIPTCHRASFDSIIADEDYKSALKYADALQKGIYEQEAKEIDRIQKEIIELSSKEEPYDVFICYKETDETGARTPDSVIANDIYYQLTQEGFKVFYAAITLEDKLGSAYEPCIFAALNSAKVMLAIGTKPEYFNAVWVKNEWSRYLKIMKNDRSKLLIPCYKDMDAYELPEEFAHLQAQDMGKIGFINDVVRGIKKVISKDDVVTAAPTTTNTVVNTSIDPLLKRAFMFLEDAEWESANEYCEKVLDINPECAEAYLGKLMAKYRISKRVNLKNCYEPFEQNPDYKKIMRFADADLKEELAKALVLIRERIERVKCENEYDDAVRSMDAAKTEQEYLAAAEQFKKAKDFRNAQQLVSECIEKAKIARKDKIYSDALSKANGNDANTYKEAIELFKRIPDWKDSKQKIEFCQEKIRRIREKEEKDRIKREELARLAQEREAAAKLERERLEQERRIEAEKRKKKDKLLFSILTPSVMIIAVLIYAYFNIIVPNNKYNKAMELMSNGQYEEAVVVFEDLDGYKDSEKKIGECSIALLEQKSGND